ncbi:NUDIX hydrolase [Solibacillus sp. R5-41]|uniref:NUDIX hydrolase n=1 Tax=Solibacillus sp. R5-41 TaxID=2048654 RepID=UPI000C12841C|nr:NUDIX hydrolase [Solibacillus sp. R5-41]ATP40931.1 NUDIX hydrolase [Solibacillus sp. R5-41]
MLTLIKDLPKDHIVGSVHCVPITEEGNIVLCWDEEEQLLTTVGGRLEQDENIDEALSRELIEEVGLIIEEKKIPFSAYYWESTNTYTIWYLAKTKQFQSTDFEYEKTGYVILNFKTAQQLLKKIEPKNFQRREILKQAEIVAKEQNWI